MQQSGSYPAAIIVMHWLLALSILFLTGLGWYMVDIPLRTPERGHYFNLHKSIGLLAMILAFVFIWWRTRITPPPMPDTMAGWEVRAAKLGHWAMYILLIVVPLSGYIESNFAKWGIDFFGIYKLESWGPTDNESAYMLLKTIHIWSANIFAVLIGLHILAAIKHIIERSGVVSRILPEFMRGKY